MTVLLDKERKVPQSYGTEKFPSPFLSTAMATSATTVVMSVSFGTPKRSKPASKRCSTNSAGRLFQSSTFVWLRSVVLAVCAHGEALYGFGAGLGLPDPSPFVVKVAHYLRMIAVAYEPCAGNARKSPKGKLPISNSGAVWWLTLRSSSTTRGRSTGIWMQGMNVSGPRARHRGQKRWKAALLCDGDAALEEDRGFAVLQKDWPKSCAKRACPASRYQRWRG